MMRHNTIELLGTSACHLCDEAQCLLLPVIEKTGVTIHLLDIAEHVDSDVLIATYGLRIPVLRRGSRELNWPFTAEQVEQWLQGQ
jgi:hypothetical protein